MVGVLVLQVVAAHAQDAREPDVWKGDDDVPRFFITLDGAEDATVLFNSRPTHAAKRADGTPFYVVTPGTYEVSAQKEGYRCDSKKVFADYGERVRLTIRCTKLPDRYEPHAPARPFLASSLIGSALIMPLGFLIAGLDTSACDTLSSACQVDVGGATLFGLASVLTLTSGVMHFFDRGWRGAMHWTSALLGIGGGTLGATLGVISLAQSETRCLQHTADGRCARIVRASPQRSLIGTVALIGGALAMASGIVSLVSSGKRKVQVRLIPLSDPAVFSVRGALLSVSGVF